MVPSRAGLVRSATPIKDADIESFIANTSLAGLRAWCEDATSVDIFFQMAQRWLRPFLGKNSLQNFSQHVLTTGTTGAFQSFYQMHSQRRLRILPGEYPFHRDLFSRLGLDWKWLTLDDLGSNDFVIMSVPFSGNGNIHPLLVPVLQKCEQLQIPVLLDCAFAGLSDLVLPDLSGYSCLQTMSFSLSKFFNIGHMRCGFAFSNCKVGADALLAEWDYGPKGAAFLGMQLMQKYPIDYLFKKYRPQQLKICEVQGLQPSSTILFGIGDSAWSEFTRDGVANRVCLSEVF